MTAYNVAAEVLTDGLVPQAYAHQRCVGFGCGRCQSQTDAGLRRVAWTGGQKDARRVHAYGVLNGQRVVSPDLHISAHFAQIVHKVVGETVVVIDQKQHFVGSFPKDAKGVEAEGLLAVYMFRLGAEGQEGQEQVAP